jgi:uncharacterized protein involved in exopolysaccharide biosynthesis
MSSNIIKPLSEPQQHFSSVAPEKSADVDLDILRSLRMHRGAAIAVAVLVFLMIVSFGLGRRPYYETQALIYVQPEKAKLITDPLGGVFDSTRYDTFIQQQLQTIVRSDILTKALSEPSAQGWRLIPGEPDQSAVVRLQHELKVERDMGSYQLTITLDGGNPVTIANVVNAVTEAYINGEHADELAQTDQRLKILEDERQRLRTDLEADRQEQAALSTNLGIADTSNEQTNPYDAELADLRTQLATASAAHQVAAVQLGSVQNGASSESLNAAAMEAAATDPGIATEKQAISQRRSLLATQMAGLTPKNPLYKQDADEIERLDQTLDSMTKDVRDRAGRQLLGKLKLEASRTADIEARFKAELAEKTALATSSTPKLQRAADLATDIVRLQGRYTDVDNAIGAIELDKSTPGLIHVLLPAIPPQKPKSSKQMLILGSALPLALFMGLVTAVFMKKLDPKVYIGKDVGKVLEFPPMAVLPSRAEVGASVVEEFMLRLVAGVDQAHRADGARTFVFTAASAGVSITELVATLAQMMERLGYRSMIVKSSAVLQNVALPHNERPYESETSLSKANSTGLMNVRRESLIVEHLDRMRQNVDLLFIEAQPFLLSSESEFSARLSDVTILVAESARTTRTELASSLALVQRLGVSGVAAVLSDVRVSNADREFLSMIHSAEAASF